MGGKGLVCRALRGGGHLRPLGVVGEDLEEVGDVGLVNLSTLFAFSCEFMPLSHDDASLSASSGRIAS